MNKKCDLTKVNRLISKDLGESENTTTFQFILDLFKKA